MCVCVCVCVCEREKGVGGGGGEESGKLHMYTIKLLSDINSKCCVCARNTQHGHLILGLLSGHSYIYLVCTSHACHMINWLPWSSDQAMQ